MFVGFVGILEANAHVGRDKWNKRIAAFYHSGRNIGKFVGSFRSFQFQYSKKIKSQFIFKYKFLNVFLYSFYHINEEEFTLKNKKKNYVFRAIFC